MLLHFPDYIGRDASDLCPKSSDTSAIRPQIACSKNHHMQVLPWKAALAQAGKARLPADKSEKKSAHCFLVRAQHAHENDRINNGITNPDFV